MIEPLGGQTSLFDRDTWSGRMSPEHSVPQKVKTSPPSLKKLSKSSSRKPPVLKCLTRDGLHGEASGMWTDDGALRGELLTLNTGESPNVAVESRLSQILEETPHTKYFLSARACDGILRRAERRGKQLPEMLKVALLTQSKLGGGYSSGRIQNKLL